MNLLLLLLSSACLWIYLLAVRTAHYYVIEDAPLHFEKFIKKYNKHYVDNDEKASRYMIFKKNLQDINRSNNASSHAVFGVNRFTDMTHDEFIRTSTGFINDRGIRFNLMCEEVRNIQNVTTPNELDWRKHRLVTPVKDQKNCGCCYAFSTTGVLEAQYARKSGMLVELSEQQIVDCDFLSHGCRGGLTTASLTALITLGGSMLTALYPYNACKGKCRSSRNATMVRLNKCHRYVFKSSDEMKQLLSLVGPVSVSIKADKLKEYHYGILDDETCAAHEINHAVLLVGYGSEKKKQFWIFKNSWGDDHGENGYFRLERSQHRDGSLGVLNYVVSASII